MPIKKNRQVLFIFHEASKTGAPMLLINLIRWIKENTSIEFEILLRNSGELENEIRELGNVKIYNAFPNRENDINYNYGLLEYYSGVDLIYSNTSTNGNLLELFSQLKIPVVTHIHELDYTIQVYGSDNFKKVLRYTDHWIAVSKAVKNNLMENYGVKEENISLVNAFIPSSFFKDISEERRLAARSSILEELGLDNTAVLVGSCGTIDWRKGADLFAQTAQKVMQRAPYKNIHFIWIGYYWDEAYWLELKHEIKMLGVEKIVHFLGFKTNAKDYLSNMEVFLLTSREDPFPIVALEAASLGKPIICFEKSGGMVDFVAEGHGIVTPFADVHQMAEDLIHLLENGQLVKKFGDKAATDLKKRYTLEILAPKIVEIINKMPDRERVEEHRPELLKKLHEAQALTQEYQLKLQQTQEELGRIREELEHSQQIRERAKQELTNVRQELAETSTELKNTQYQLQIVANSNSYRFGKVVLFPLRVLKRLIKK